MGIWTICSNHLAVQEGSTILHFTAEEMYTMLENNENAQVEGVSIPPVSLALANVHFSTVGAEIRCSITNGTDSDEYILQLFCERYGEVVSIDMVDGVIIDHCIWHNEWFYVSGNTVELNMLLNQLGIENQGRISIVQYIGILRYQKQNDSSSIQILATPLKEKKSIMDPACYPVGLHAKLYHYQYDGFLWMKYIMSEGAGCVLADEMGLGKTLQIIALILERRNQNQKPALVVAPVSLLENWRRECSKFAPSIKVLIHHGRNRTGLSKLLLKYDIVIISYATAVSDSSLLSMIQWDLVILDEAQNIKNPGSERARFVKRIPRQHGIAVTGTPFENHVSDIWSIIDFVLPNALGTLAEFSRMVPDDLSGALIVEPLISPLMLRRKVADVARDLPEKVIIPQPIRMSDIESAHYEEIRQEINRSTDPTHIDIRCIQKLRMFCTHPFLCQDCNCGDIFEASIKYQRLCEILEEIITNNEKVILFTSYLRMFDIIDSDIKKRFNIPVFTINGGTPVEDRQMVVDQFNSYPQAALLVLNPRAAGTGLNITSANHVIHYNLEWNPALEDQASARAYRRGQERTVFIYRLYYEDTVEAIVNERIERKRNISETAIVGVDGKLENKNDLLAALAASPIMDGGMYNND